jgi:hypothetical protein
MTPCANRTEIKSQWEKLIDCCYAYGSNVYPKMESISRIVYPNHIQILLQSNNLISDYVSLSGAYLSLKSNFVNHSHILANMIL